VEANTSTERNRARSREYMRHRRETDPEYKARQLAHTRQWRANLKAEVFSHYGGPKCACCAEAELLFLQLDHVNGGGGKFRKRRTGYELATYAVYIDIKRRGFPPGEFQVLCGNCNMGKHLNGGVCPHQKDNG
jgi:hypothetical protein